MQFRESCDATCINENIVIDEGNENMINVESTDEGYVNDTELSDSSSKDTPEKKSFNTLMGNISADWTSLK